MSIQYAMLLLYLGIETDTDVKRKEISAMHWLLMICLLFIPCLYRYGFEDMVGSMVPGILIMAFAKITEGAVGYGDGMILIICGMVLGLERVCALFVMALLLLFPISLWKIVVHKANRKEEIAFLPFLLASYLIILALA